MSHITALPANCPLANDCREIVTTLQRLCFAPAEMSHSPIPKTHLRGEALVTFSWFLELRKKILYCLHSCELITNLCVTKSIVSSCCSNEGPTQTFNYSCVFYNVIGSSSQKSTEARGIGWMSQDPLIFGESGNRPIGSNGPAVLHVTLQYTIY